ncbi:MAG: penicillin-binding protein activator [Alphaproteobacteria bacterium]|nr:penicillin-binding protein activator [Alphaproteobacteria bacterium]
MQVLKKFSLLALCYIMAACSTSGNKIISDKGGVSDFNTDISEINITDAESFRVGMLLPLTGAAAKHGQGLKNASMLALDDIKNENLILQYYDTQSTPSGARIAAENAIRQGAKILIGPLMSVEVQAIAEETIYQGVPVIAFSTAQEVLQPTVYTMGLLVEEQVDRIVSYAAAQNRKRLALLIPDNSTGNAVARAALKSAEKNHVEVTVIGYYPPETSDFSGIIKQMTNYNERHAEVLRLKANLEALTKNGDASAAYELKQISTKEGIGDVGFDMVLIPESGAKLTSAISMFAYYDAAYPDVQFLGTSVWEGGKFNNESVMRKSWYPAISRAYSGYFAGKYNQIFNERPSSLYSFAYDAIALVNELSRSESENLNSKIINPDGYRGINGAFRFFEDGTNQHSLDIMEIGAEGDVSIDRAPNKFFDDGSAQRLPSINTDENLKTPRIFGKDQQSAQIAIYGTLLQPATQSLNEQ